MTAKLGQKYINSRGGRFFLVFVIPFFLFLILGFSRESRAGETFQLSSNTTSDGTLIVLQIEDSKETPFLNIKVHFEEQNLPVFEGSNPLKKYALVPIPFNSKPRDSKIVVQYQLKEKGEILKKELTLKIEDGGYRSEVLKITNTQTVAPNKKNANRIVAEQKEVGAVYKIEGKKRLWSGRFIKPIDSEITSPYGNKRVYNGMMKSFHQGMDFRAKVGTPIKAPEGGAVVMAKELFLTGGTVILDHGLGFFTVYCHMSEMKVKLGENVTKGQLLGLSGATGRVSGPHLHWGAVINHQKINPENLLHVLPDVL